MPTIYADTDTKSEKINQGTLWPQKPQIFHLVLGVQFASCTEQNSSDSGVSLSRSHMQWHLSSLYNITTMWMCVRIWILGPCHTEKFSLEGGFQKQNFQKFLQTGKIFVNCGRWQLGFIKQTALN